MEEIMAKNGMLHFGDVSVGHHPGDDAPPPVPMVIPMAYLVPVVTKEQGRQIFKYRMFVPVNGVEPVPMPPANLVPHPPPPPQLNIHIPNEQQNGGEKKAASNSRKRRTSSVSNDSDVGTATKPANKDQTPLDLSKGQSSEDEDATTATAGEIKSVSPLAKTREIEAQLNFLKAKHMELLQKHSQQQQQQQQVVNTESRCEECNINFSKHQVSKNGKKWPI